MYDYSRTMLHVHRADRADALARALGTLLATPPPDPLTPEVVGVPTRGVERWLTQTLCQTLGASAGRQDGIVANVHFPSPRQIVDEAVAAACDVDPERDPWAPERMVWPLLDLVDEHLADALLTTLAAHLRDASATSGTGEQPRRLAAVRHLAHLYDRYALHRPAMICAWRDGEDVDGSGDVLGAERAWQAALWRLLRERLGTPSPAERLGTATARLAQDASLLALPARIALFGLTRLPAGHAAVLRAVAAQRDVHLYLLHPSPALWDAIAVLAPASARRADDAGAAAAHNPLLASWGRDVRELQLLLGGRDADHCHAGEHPAPATLLAHLQADIRADRRPPAARVTLTDADASIEIHSCHGRARQVEVLRDAILHTLQDDASLQPRDVIVMCPDIETFAPLIQATFGTAQDSGDDAAPDLRVRLADRAVRQTNPVLGTIGRLLELADQRMTASQVLDFADRGPVRRRFALDDEDLVRIEDWIVKTEIRWGLDAEHRAPFRLEPVAANTWRAGLDRILLGVTMTEDAGQLVGGVLPLDDVDSGAIDLAGRMAELLHRLTATVDAMRTPMPLAAWAAAIAGAADLLTATAPRDAWQRGELDALLGALAEHAAGAADAPLQLAEVRDLLAEHLKGRPTRANFRTGHLTFCTLNPMRSVPHRVVCLLGLDDTVFPRKAPRDGDDLIVEDPHVGDHDARTEDRQLLLDALLAAQDKLIVTFTGNDERTNAPHPPAVPVGELLDVIAQTATAPDGGPARDAILTRHPLQPFDPRNFDAAKPFGFDPVTLDGARAMIAPRAPRAPLLSGPLPATHARVIDLDDVVRFVQHPARAFLRQRLGISLRSFEEDLKDDLPIDLDGLEAWGVGERLLAAVLAGHSEEQALAAERARGALPPGRLGDATIAGVGANVRAIAQAATARLGATGGLDSLDARVALADGRLLSGTVAGVNGRVLQVVSYSRLSPRHRLGAWVRLLALTVAHPDLPLQAVTIGRSGGRAGPVAVARIAPLDASAAQRHLGELVDLYDRGLCEPPPLACATSAAYAAATRSGHDALSAAGEAWRTRWRQEREDKDPEHRLVHGGVVSLEHLLDPAAGPAEAAWGTGQPSRFGAWAVRLWAGLLAVEELSER